VAVANGAATNLGIPASTPVLVSGRPARSEGGPHAYGIANASRYVFCRTNSHDVHSMIALFSDTAVVKDEGKEHRGINAIRKWAEEANPTIRLQGGTDRFHRSGG